MIIGHINIGHFETKMEDSISNFSKTAPSSFTDYNQQLQTYHLIKWVLNASAGQEQTLVQSSSLLGYTIKSIYHSNSLPFILHQMCPQIFPMRLPVNEMETLFMDYFQRQFGFYVKSLLMLEDRKQKTMIRLILYACLYSAEKEMFVGNILKLEPQVQQKLVNEIEDVQQELKQLKNWDKMFEVIKNLQSENHQLVTLLEQCQKTAQKHAEEIRSLHQELDQTKKQLNLLVVEKRKILGNFSLSSLADYEDLCLHLKIENEQLLIKQEKLQQIIKDLQKQVFLLQQGLNNSEIVIVELNSQCFNLQKSYVQVTKQLSTIQQSFSLENESKIHSINKSMSATADMTMPSEIKPKKDSVRESFPIDVFNNTNRSSFAQSKMSLGRNSRNSAAWNMFNTTKNNVLLNAKVQVFQEKIEQLKLKIAELELEIGRLQQSQRKYMKRTRRIQKLTDEFQSQYEQINGRYEVIW